jgi:hypothetical protein
MTSLKRKRQDSDDDDDEFPLAKRARLAANSEPVGAVGDVPALRPQWEIDLDVEASDAMSWIGLGPALRPQWEIDLDVEASLPFQTDTPTFFLTPGDGGRHWLPWSHQEEVKLVDKMLASSKMSGPKPKPPPPTPHDAAAELVQANTEFKKIQPYFQKAFEALKKSLNGFIGWQNSLEWAAYNGDHTDGAKSSVAVSMDRTAELTARIASNIQDWNIIKVHLNHIASKLGPAAHPSSAPAVASEGDLRLSRQQLNDVDAKIGQIDRLRHLLRTRKSSVRQSWESDRPEIVPRLTALASKPFLEKQTRDISQLIAQLDSVPLRNYTDNPEGRNVRKDKLRDPGIKFSPKQWAKLQGYRGHDNAMFLRNYNYDLNAIHQDDASLALSAGSAGAAGTGAGAGSSFLPPDDDDDARAGLGLPKFKSV